MTPLLSWLLVVSAAWGEPDAGGERVTLEASARLSYQRTNSFPTDALGTHLWGKPLPVEPFESRLRVAPRVQLHGFGLLIEVDAATGTIFGLPRDGLVAGRTPHPTFKALELRQLFVEYRSQTAVVRAGQQTSHWGLGLLANGGAKDPEPGDFGAQRFGSIVQRAMIAGRLGAIEPLLAAELVVRDGYADLAAGDQAFQGILAVRFLEDAARHAGICVVYRRQRAAGVSRATDVAVVDFTGAWEWKLPGPQVVSLAFEAAAITGSTRSASAPGLQIRQYGALVKAGWRLGQAQLLVDWGYASGDRNLNDDRLESFRFDQDLKVGLVLFEDVLGWQSARSAQRVADFPVAESSSEDPRLAPTGGSVTAAWYLFPRVRYGVFEWLDVYGGPLFAISTGKLVDPFNSRSGAPTNYLGGTPGDYLGTEVDLGAQARWKPSGGWLLSAALEVGLLVPGDAFTNAAGRSMDPVGMVRVRIAAGL